MSQNLYTRWAKFRSRFPGSVEAAFEAFVNTDLRLQNENRCSDCGSTTLWLNADHIVEGNRNKRCRPCQQAFLNPEEDSPPTVDPNDKVLAFDEWFDEAFDAFKAEVQNRIAELIG